MRGTGSSQSLSFCGVASSGRLLLGLVTQPGPGPTAGGSAAANWLDLSLVAARTDEPRTICTNEKEQLQGLDDRFAVFTEERQEPETQKRARQAQEHHTDPSRALSELFRRQLRAQLKEARSAHAQAPLLRDRLGEEV